MSQKKILVVDDDAMCRKAVVNFATKAGIAVDIAESGEAGVALVLSNSYLLILIDLFMPGLSGYESAQKMIETSSGTLGDLVIMSGDELEKDEYEKHGFKHFIQKPVSKKAFEQLLHTFKLV